MKTAEHNNGNEQTGHKNLLHSKAERLAKTQCSNIIVVLLKHLRVINILINTVPSPTNKLLFDITSNNYQVILQIN